MKSEMRGEDVVDWVRAKTAPPAVRLGYGGQFPGVRRFRRRRWERVTGVEGKANCFHVMSRLTDGLAFFEDEEKEALVVLLWKMARFCKVRVLTYCVMGNHFHALIEVPDHDEAVGPFRASEADGRPAEGALELDAGWERLLTHLGSLYSRKYVLALRAEMERYLKAGQSEQVEEVREAFLARIGDLSRFMRELKERFTKWYNKLHGRRGGIWQGRFKSVLVQGHDEEGEADGGWSKALRTMAAYIDLNPVRAGLVEDPADYRWCGYAAALGGSRRARRGLSHVMGGRRADWEAKTADEYRKLLVRYGFEMIRQGGPGSRGGGADGAMSQQVKRKEPEKEHQAESRSASAREEVYQKGAEEYLQGRDCGGRLKGELDLASRSLGSFLRGVAVGEKAFVEAIFERYRECFGEKRKDGARVAGAKQEKIFCLRRIRSDE